MHHTLSISLSVIYDLGFALFHLTFWRWLKWPQSLKNSGKLNQSVTQTLNVMLSYVLFVYGASLGLVTEQIQGLLALSGGGFWLLRTIAQPTLFARTRLSWIMAAVFALGASLHIVAYLASMEASLNTQSSETSHS
ncbi:hypothetical protein [Ralstonia mojiangensis]|uniref:hypothetical protein n=1 Tax=Ralstonia mojiangensis TaxID=2953895 RepID=UPI0021B1ECE4|nr:hypothetical protein [Ralstonia mojiangensis]MCT7325033.1 hypothetical protein [Ralstonia mojiangensis]